MNFLSDGLGDGRKRLYLNIVDDHMKECRAIEVNTSSQGELIAEMLKRYLENKAIPEPMTVANGPNEPRRCSMNGELALQISSCTYLCKAYMQEF